MSIPNAHPLNPRPSPVPGRRRDCAAMAGALALTLWAVWVGPAAATEPLKLGKTEMRTNVRDRSHDPQDELVYKSNGPVLDERHLQRNQTGRTDGKVHVNLVSTGDGRYQLVLQSLDTGRLKQFRANIRLTLPTKVSCRGGYWQVVDLNLLESGLTTSPDFPYYASYSNVIDVLVDQAAGRSFHFTGGRMVIEFGVVEACT